MSRFWTKVVGDKKEWRSMEARSAALPRDYRVVYREMKQYMLSSPRATGWTSSRC